MNTVNYGADYITDEKKLKHFLLFSQQFWSLTLSGRKPSKSAKPHKRFQSDTKWGIGNEKRINRFFFYGPSDEQPDSFLRQPLMRKNNMSFGKLVLDWALGAFRNLSAVPKIIIYVLSQFFNCYAVILPFAVSDKTFLVCS